MEEIEKKEKEKKLIQEQNKLKKYLKENYFNYNCNIYRCLFCHQIPIINIDEINHQIETYCNCIYTINKNKNINNYIFPYKYFEEKSLYHPIDNNITCLYCKKNINELNNENIHLYLCDFCNDIICSKDELIHKNQKHLNNKELKEKYNNLIIDTNIKKREDKILKVYKNKTNNEKKNKSTLLSNQNSIVKKNSQVQKNDKNVKEEKKSFSFKKSMTLSNNKKNINKKGDDKIKPKKKLI